MFSGLASFDELKTTLIDNGINDDDIQIFNTANDFLNLPLRKYNLMNVLNNKFTKFSVGHAVLLIKLEDDMFYYFDPTSAISNELLETVLGDIKAQILCNLDQLQDYKKNQSCGWYVVREILLFSIGKLRVRNYVILSYDKRKITCIYKHIESDYDVEYNSTVNNIEERKIFELN